MAAKNGLVLAGNNEDRNFLKTIISFLPKTERYFGRIVFGFTDALGQGGMNDQGLMIDGNRIPSTGWKEVEGKPYFRNFLIFHILATCATVEDVKTFFKTYNVPGLERARFPIADRSGASMVVEFAKGEVQFVENEKWYQIATNFVMSDVKNENYPCWRYNTADKILGDAEELDIDLMREVLEATQQKGNSLTVYSNVYDLKKGIIYVYNKSDFTNPVILDLEEELKVGKRNLNLPELFEEKNR